MFVCQIQCLPRVSFKPTASFSEMVLPVLWPCIVDPKTKYMGNLGDITYTHVAHDMT